MATCKFKGCWARGDPVSEKPGNLVQRTTDPTLSIRVSLFLGDSAIVIKLVILFLNNKNINGIRNDLVFLYFISKAKKGKEKKKKTWGRAGQRG